MTMGLFSFLSGKSGDATGETGARSGDAGAPATTADPTPIEYEPGIDPADLAPASHGLNVDALTAPSEAPPVASHVESQRPRPHADGLGVDGAAVALGPRFEYPGHPGAELGRDGRFRGVLRMARPRDEADTQQNTEHPCPCEYAHRFLQ